MSGFWKHIRNSAAYLNVSPRSKFLTHTFHFRFLCVIVLVFCMLSPILLSVRVRVAVDCARVAITLRLPA